MVKYRRSIVSIFAFALVITLSSQAYAGGHIFKSILDSIVDLTKTITSDIVSAAETLSGTNPNPDIDTSPTIEKVNATQLVLITNDAAQGKYNQNSAASLTTIGNKKGLINF